MGQFFLKSIILIGLVLLCLNFLDPYFYQNHQYRNTIKGFEELEKNSLSLAFFGNSQTYSSFDPRIFELELDVNTFNFGGGAQKLTATKVIADMVLRNSHLDLAVINVFSANIFETVNEQYKSFYLKAVDPVPLSWEKTKSINSIFPLREQPEALSKLIRNHSKWDSLTPISNRFPYFRTQDTYKGFNTYTIHYDSKEYNKFKEKYNKRSDSVFDLSEKQKKYIDDLINLFQNHQVPLLFVNAPSKIYNESVRERTTSQAIAKYVRSKGKKMLDFNEVDAFYQMDSSYYRNPNHLNTKGSIMASQYLVRYIMDSLKIQLKKGNVNLQNNRYYILKHPKKGLFHKELDSSMQKKLFGIAGTILYHKTRDRYELIFPLTADTIGEQPFRLEHDVAPVEVKTYIKQKAFFNKDSTKVIFWGDFEKSDVLKYNDQYFVIYQFQTPLKVLRNLSFHGGDKRLAEAFRIDSLTLKP